MSKIFPRAFASPLADLVERIQANASRPEYRTLAAAQAYRAKLSADEEAAHTMTQSAYAQLQQASRECNEMIACLQVVERVRESRKALEADQAPLADERRQSAAAFEKATKAHEAANEHVRSLRARIESLRAERTAMLDGAIGALPAAEARMQEAIASGDLRTEAEAADALAAAHADVEQSARRAEPLKVRINALAAAVTEAKQKCSAASDELQKAQARFHAAERNIAVLKADEALNAYVHALVNVYAISREASSTGSHLPDLHGLSSMQLWVGDVRRSFAAPAGRGAGQGVFSPGPSINKLLSLMGVSSGVPTATPASSDDDENEEQLNVDDSTDAG